jgi:RNA polymerase sigma-70 factor (ECF subfamily)
LTRLAGGQSLIITDTASEAISGTAPSFVPMQDPPDFPPFAIPGQATENFRRRQDLKLRPAATTTDRLRRQEFSESPQVSRFPYERLGDAELVQAVAQGDVQAVGVVWDRYSSPVRSVIRANLGADGAIEDLLQEVFVVFLRSVDEIKKASTLRGFLVQVAVRVVLVELRRRRLRRWVTLSRSSEVLEAIIPSRDGEGAAALAGLYRLLNRLPERRRVAFVLRHVQGLELSEVASALAISESTARREIARARTAIQTRARKSEPSLWHYLERGDAP